MPRNDAAARCLNGARVGQCASPISLRSHPQSTLIAREGVTNINRYMLVCLTDKLSFLKVGDLSSALIRLSGLYEGTAVISFLPAATLANAGIRCRRVSVCLSVRPSVCHKSVFY